MSPNELPTAVLETTVLGHTAKMPCSPLSFEKFLLNVPLPRKSRLVTWCHIAGQRRVLAEEDDTVNRVERQRKRCEDAEQCHPPRLSFRSCHFCLAVSDFQQPVELEGASTGEGQHFVAYGTR